MQSRQALFLADGLSFSQPLSNRRLSVRSGPGLETHRLAWGELLDALSLEDFTSNYY